ncbi:MAG: tetratricopeptide repeat protein, partial [Spirochaetaceae bacterium]|nr:tetratricopeptide repeat protein [Spirochaetaceae bacterium]
MSFIITVLAVAVFVVAVFFIFWFFVTKTKNKGKRPIENKKKPQNKEQELRNALKTIEKNPRDPHALFVIAENKFERSEWKQAFKYYELLAEIPNTKGEFDPVLVNMRASVCASNQNLPDDAFKYIVVAHALAPSNFDVTFQLGSIEFQRKNYEKAVQFLQQAYSLNASSAPVMRLLGHSYFKLKKTREAMAYIHKAIDLMPDDKESLFTLAECYEESAQIDQALRIYTHLRPDPVWGAQA